ncbi:class I adenylate-forming enzyme family protein [Micromonospora sp. WMMD998]|uniref:class I adenylate-forming enzyme family protein n=1 Tax=Micromonospora sp. WMMD998 TaxID=3016092 RepID=UPI002499E176|nr:class I adenylate-forming enzyme family protein [Micromonospora sp. WMMD998]WFE40993.1 class I adenylate-forming enzyme family protein [Micromonospora sp. WMMD998]
MSYVDVAPGSLLARGPADHEVTEGAWRVRWDRVAGDPGELVRGHMAPDLDFHTSGSTGESLCWRRGREAAWREAGLLADLVAEDRPGAVVSFVPPVHIYGALATLLLPARLGAPVWYRKSFFGPMPEVESSRVLVVATPWIFTLLLQHLDWVRRFERVTVLHSSAMLPDTAGQLRAEVGGDRLGVVEILGSTETGGIATRRWATGAPGPWTLFPDVTFADPPEGAGAGKDSPLVVRSPRLAYRPGAAPPRQAGTGDLVRRRDDRTFDLVGRSSRLVKVNGRRVNLDDRERVLRAAIDCADLALVPVADPVIGEHVDLLVVAPGRTLADLDLAAGFAAMGMRPRKVHLVPGIDRSETGKLRYRQPTITADAEVAT